MNSLASYTYKGQIRRKQKVQIFPNDSGKSREIDSFNDVTERQDNLALIIMSDTLLAVIAILLLMHDQDMCI